MLQLLGDSSGGHNIVGEAKSRPPYNPAPTVDAAWVEVYYQYRGEDGLLVGALIPLGRFAPTARVSLPENTTGLIRLSVFTVPYNAHGVPAVDDPLLGERLDIDPDRPAPTTTAAGLDEAVPTVTKAPTVAKAGAEMFLIFTPAPDAHGATVTDGEIRLRRAGTLEAVGQPWTIPSGPSHHVPQPAFDVEVSYRWRNQFRGGGSEGWSAWSPDAPGAGAGSASQPPPAGAANEDFIYDEFDSRAGIERTVLEQ
jgi:hypothetical protein